MTTAFDRIASEDPSASISGFVCGFFDFLERRGATSAVLHGWKDGFEGELSDVDFAVDASTFDDLPKWINEWCGVCGWMLCQVLRHETTAAYYVCASVAKPEVVVALDACSDYQRNGTFFLTAGEMLESRVPIPSGGQRVADEVALRYRFSKAAAKNKSVEDCVSEFAEYSQETRALCSKWLEQAWGISPGEWDSDSLKKAFRSMAEKFHSRPPFVPSELLRIAGRIFRPTGMVVVTGRESSDQFVSELEKCFGHLYFRRTRIAERWNFRMMRDLVRSTLILVPEFYAPVSWVVPRGCLYRVAAPSDFPAVSRDLAVKLNRRCFSREGLDEARAGFSYPS